MWSKAESHFQSLNQKLPNQIKVISGWADALMGMQKYSEALLLWRKIGASSNAGSDSWFQAKLGVVRCTLEVKPARAKEILLQMKQLAGTIPEPWNTRATKLQQQINDELKGD